MCIHQTKVWCNGKTTEIGSGGGGGQPHPWVRQFTQIWPKFNYSILVSIVTILTNIVVILTSMIQYLKNVVTLEVERAGFFKIMSWAEPEFFLFWWAELSRANAKLTFDIWSEPIELFLLAHFLVHKMSWAGHWKILSWAEPSWKQISNWWAELSRAGQLVQIGELSWAELAQLAQLEP